MAPVSHRAAPARRRNRPLRRLLSWLRRRPLLVGVTVIALVTVAASVHQNAEGRASGTPPQATPGTPPQTTPGTYDCLDTDCPADGTPPRADSTGDPAPEPSDDCEEGDCPRPVGATGQEARTGPPSATADPAPAPASHTPRSGTASRPWPLLGSGSHGAPVAAIQLLLTAHGYRTDSDAAFGPATTAQVRSFQRDNSLVADGIVGPDTWHALIVDVRSGDRGPAVTAVQRLLAVHGRPVDVDGMFGPATAEAVGAFQRACHLAPDSVVGPDTWAALLNAG